MLTVAIGCGCFFSRAVPLKGAEYGLEYTGFAGKSSIRTGAVTNISGSGRNFMIRSRNSRISADETRRFAAAPEEMLKALMLIRFCGENTDSVINARIIKFEFSGECRTLSAAVVFAGRINGRNFGMTCHDSVEVKNGNYGLAVSELFDKMLTECNKKSGE